jgi:predicted tellurium resistance membrane protein TerC
MEWFADPSAWLGLATLVLLEIVLGIDNLIFVSILAEKLPAKQRQKARMIGLSLALGMRLVFLASIFWIVHLTEPLLTVSGFTLSGRDLIFLGGGLFLLYKATKEMHERVENSAHMGGDSVKKGAKFWSVVLQIIILDLVFSIDSVVTAVGMVNHLDQMIIAVIIAMMVMMFASKPLAEFINKRPTVVVLCLGFLMMIGFSLIADGLGFHVPKSYLYVAIGFSIFVEGINQVINDRGKKRRPR